MASPEEDSPSLWVGQTPEVADLPAAVVRVLLVEDNPGDADLVREALDGDAGTWEIVHVPLLRDASSELNERPVDVVLLDLSLPDASGLDGVARLANREPKVPVVVLTGLGDPDGGMRAVRQGAQEYLLKSEMDRRVLGRVLRYSIERHAASLRAQLLAREHFARVVAEESRRRAEVLAEASVAAASTLDEADALRQVASILVPRIATACAIERLDESGGVRCLVVLHSSDRSVASDLRVTGTRTSDALRSSWARGPRIEDQPGPLCWGTAASDGLAALHLQSAIVVPLSVREQPLGTLFLGTQGSYDAADLAAAEEIARRVTAAIDTSRLHARALDAIQIRDDFLSIAGHELRNPLTSITLDAAQIEQEGESCSERLRRRLERIARSAERVRSLVDDLLDVSRIRSARLALDLDYVDLGAAVGDVGDRFAAPLASVGSELRVSAPPGIYGRWDRSRVQQVISNLLQNALRYAPGKPVELAVVGDDRVAFVSVHDHGPGIDPADHKRIFERFSRAPSKASTQGLGLGLWIARGIVEAHGGRLSVASELGNGSDFRIELPLSGPPGPALAAEDGNG